MAYDLFDFTESLDRVGIDVADVSHVSLGFGESTEGWAQWEGGFVFHRKTGAPWTLVIGWCDTTGWGCQDGAFVHTYGYEPSEAEIRAAWAEDMGEHSDPPPLELADKDPIDLNRFVKGEIDRWGAER